MNPPGDDPVTPSPWQALRAHTPARIALGRAGNALPTDEVLRFGWAHASARDAIHAPLDVDALAAALHAQGWATLRARSQATDRATYLRRPDLGRRLDPEAAALLSKAANGGAVDLAIVIGDGLSALAAARHAAPLLAALHDKLPAGLRIAPAVLATQARVALADEIGALLGARLAVMLLGERPGLSAPDSLGIYITHAPRPGLPDALRNCISNVRPEGLPVDAAAARLAWLVREALRRGVTGVALKDESEHAALSSEAASGPADPRPSFAARDRP